MPNKSVDVLGIGIDGWTLDALIDQVVAWAMEPQPSQRTVVYANVHVLNTAYKHRRLLDELRSASTVYCDGSGARFGAWLLGQRLPPRITGADWIDPLCERLSREGLSLFLLGGEQGVATRAADRLVQRHPRLRIAGTHHGYLTQDADSGLTRIINDTAAHILLIGMGTPRQELWIGQHRYALRPQVLWAVGALFDFIAGVEHRAPNWMLASHLEWAGRLMANPGRQWRRYLLGNPLFVTRVLKQRFVGLPDKLRNPEY